MFFAWFLKNGFTPSCVILQNFWEIFSENPWTHPTPEKAGDPHAHAHTQLAAPHRHPLAAAGGDNLVGQVHVPRVNPEERHPRLSVHLGGGRRKISVLVTGLRQTEQRRINAWKRKVLSLGLDYFLPLFTIFCSNCEPLLCSCGVLLGEFLHNGDSVWPGAEMMLEQKHPLLLQVTYFARGIILLFLAGCKLAFDVRVASHLHSMMQHITLQVSNIHNFVHYAVLTN